MDIANMIGSSQDVEATKAKLTNAKLIVQEAAKDYAKAALGAAEETLALVCAGAPAIATRSHLEEYMKFSRKAHNSLMVAYQLADLVLAIEETGNPEIDEANKVRRMEQVNGTEVSALIEGAVTRMAEAVKGIPADLSLGAMCSPNALGIHDDE